MDRQRGPAQHARSRIEKIIGTVKANQRIFTEPAKNALFIKLSFILGKFEASWLMLRCA
jgi:hypothetical protein